MKSESPTFPQHHLHDDHSVRCRYHPPAPESVHDPLNPLHPCLCLLLHLSKAPSYLTASLPHSSKVVSAPMKSKSIADLTLPQIKVTCTTTSTRPPTIGRNTSHTYRTPTHSTSTPPISGRSKTNMLNPRRQSAMSPAPVSPSAIPRPHSVTGSHRPRLSSDAASQRASPEPDIRNVRVGTYRSTLFLATGLR